MLLYVKKKAHIARAAARVSVRLQARASTEAELMDLLVIRLTRMLWAGITTAKCRAKCK